jgi:hypothetical protein
MAPAGMRDGWDKADIIVKAVGSALMPLTLAGLAIFGNQYLQESQAREARNRLQTELMTKREDSESALRKDMFKSIIDSFLKPPGSRDISIAEKMLHLQLLAYNFYESLNLKPLFHHVSDDLENRLARYPVRRPARGSGRALPCGGDAQAALEACQATLSELARYISEKQRAMLEQVGHKFDMTLKVEDVRQQTAGGVVQLNEATLSLLPGVERIFHVDALDVDRDVRKILVRLSVTSLPLNQQQQYEFWVDPFDFPIIDNIRLSNDERFALVLTSIDDDKKLANLTAVYFPGAYASLKEKPYMDEAIRRLVPTGKVAKQAQ